MIKVHKDGSDYVLRDDDGMQYGKYSDKKDAQCCADDWNEYYSSPLLAEPTKEAT